MRYSIGVDVKRNMMDVGLFDEDKRLVARRVIEPDPTILPLEFFEFIVRAVRDFMEERVITNDNINGLSVVLPAIIKLKEGRIIKCLGYPKLAGFDARGYLNDRLGDIRIVIDSAVNAYALAEYRYGAGRNRPQMIYCSLDADIAASAILNNEISSGIGGISGLFGHCVVERNEDVECECGSLGCISSWGSGDAIVRHVRLCIERGEPTVIDEIAGRADYITPEHINTAYERGDALAEKVIKQAAKHIGIWIYNMCVHLNTDCVVISGSLLQMGKKLAGPMRKTFDTCNNIGVRVDFANAQIKRDRGIIGAVELLYYNE